jgi:hypothetical protein
MSTPHPIWILDEVTTRPGQGPAFLDAYMARYAPKAEARGMTLAYRMVEPAMWLDDAPNRLLFVWTMPDAGAVWQSKYIARPDPDVARWWDEEAPAFIESRRRSTLADADALAGLADV